MWQVSNPEAAESLDLFMKSDYDEEDKDWAITIKAPGHWLRKCGVDPSKSGYSWQSYDDNNDVWIKYATQTEDPLPQQKAHMESLLSSYSNIKIL